MSQIRTGQERFLCYLINYLRNEPVETRHEVGFSGVRLENLHDLCRCTGLSTSEYSASLRNVLNDKTVLLFGIAKRYGVGAFGGRLVWVDSDLIPDWFDLTQDVYRRLDDGSAVDIGDQKLHQMDSVKDVEHLHVYDLHVYIAKDTLPKTRQAAYDTGLGVDGLDATLRAYAKELLRSS